MRVVTVHLKNFDEICEFHGIIENSSAVFDMQQRHIMVDGKSIIGIMGLDLAAPIKLSVNGTDDEEERIVKAIAKYLAE